MSVSCDDGADPGGALSSCTGPAFLLVSGDSASRPGTTGAVAGHGSARRSGPGNPGTPFCPAGPVTADLRLGFLLFMAGYEIDLRRFDRPVLVLVGRAFAVSSAPAQAST
jgi:hypothetical protein